MSITTSKPAKTIDRVYFTLSPAGTPFGFTINGHSYPSTGAAFTPINTAITFTAAGAISGALGFEWDFDDGSNGYGNPVVHTFTVANPHLRVRLQVTNAAGDHLYAAKQLYLYESVVAPALYPATTLYPAPDLLPN